MKLLLIIISFVISGLSFAETETLYDKASKLMTEKKFVEALIPLAEHIKNNSKDDKAYNLLGIAYRNLAGIDDPKKAEEYIKKSEDYFFKAITLNTNNNEARINLASLAYNLGHKQKAILLYNDALRIDSQNITALEALAVIMIGENKIDEAKVFYIRLAKKEPKRKGVNMGLAIIAMNEKRIKDARDLLKKEIDVDKTNLEPYFNLAVAYEFNDQAIRGGKGAKPDKAIEYYEKTLKIDPEYVDALFNIAIIYGTQKKYDKAIEYTKKALKKAKDSYVAYYNLGCFYSLKGEKSDAIKNLTKSIELGYRDFEYIEADTDLDNIRKEQGYLNLVTKYKKKTNI